MDDDKNKSDEKEEDEEGATNFGVVIDKEVVHGSEQRIYTSGKFINELTDIYPSKPALYHSFAIFEAQYLFKELNINNILIFDCADLISMPKDYSLGVSISEDMNMGYGIPILFR